MAVVMSEYCEDHCRAALGLDTHQPIPDDVFEAVTKLQHDNDVIDGPKISLDQVTACISGIGKKEVKKVVVPVVAEDKIEDSPEEEVVEEEVVDKKPKGRRGSK